MPLSTTAKKRKVLEGLQGKTGRPQKKFRKQREYHSSSDEAEDDEPTDFKAVSLADSDEDEVEVKKPKKQTKSQIASKNRKEKENSDDDGDDSDESADSDNKKDEKDNASGSDASSGAEDEDDDYDSDVSMPTSTTDHRAVPKRNDPSAFSTSISKILATKLPSSARADPVLSRSKTATQASTDFADEKLDKQARAKLRAEKQEELDRGRIRDVLGIERGEAGAVAEEEKRLRKIAQRGVVKLFNAVRAAQVRGEEAARGERKKGTIGIGEREKAVNEVSKQGFLELISGKKGKPLNIEEA
ncbi:Rrp15p-domain-containing protein [Aspergillus pseudotamarii]|uniref:Rrp15p-domain-containing protein n=1 Tax=Aspergillus pseudotamarii TaxID=132259 RepID=A0A5N6SJJ4_ASPPS|nr:Rrp15p-domain-containing protein [Aspergillus pseudotamarii]KAE8134856.1 Rrp15p-domain-containing protein [Aspergillus pseudotamarii]